MMIIKITNMKSKQHIQLMDNAAFYEYVGIPCEENRINASTNGNYSFRSVTGLKTLPSNNNITYKGIDQDGSTFLSNNYDDRHIIINLFLDNYSRINQILYQEDVRLKIDVQTDIAIYTTYGSVLGSFEGSVLELLCDPFFDLDEIRKYTFTILQNFVPEPFLPLTMPRIWFESERSNREISFDIGVSGVPVITLEGIFTGPAITNTATGQTAYLPNVSTTSKLVMDVVNRTITSDGRNVLSNLSGYFTEMITGTNIFVFSFDEQLTDVNVTIEFAEVTSYVI